MSKFAIRNPYFIIVVCLMIVSDSILIVEFTRHLREHGMSVRQTVVTAARVRLRPVLMNSLATIIRHAADGAQTRRRQRVLRAPWRVRFWEA